MSGKTMTITIEVEGGNPQATIRCGDDMDVVDGLALFAGSEADGNLMTFYWNRPGMAAKAVVTGCAAAIDRGDAWAAQFYRAMLHGLSSATGVRPERKEVDPEDVPGRRAREDPKIRIHQEEYVFRSRVVLSAAEYPRLEVIAGLTGVPGHLVARAE